MAEKTAEIIKTGAKVLAHHGPMIYEAKVMKMEQRATESGNKEPQYFLHYQGWNKKWDEWVEQSRVMVYNETNLLLQKQHNSKKRAAANNKKNELEKKAAGGGKQDKGRKRKIDTTRELEDDGGEAQVKLPMPFNLKKQLVDDWENITREPQHLVKLPRTPSVADILDQFLDSKRKKQAAHIQTFQEVMDGIRIYFDRALGTILLYRFERPQYLDIKEQHPNKKMSEIYGAEHLLRLFVRLPYLLAQTTLDESEMTHIQTKLGEFLKFLQKNHTQFFMSEYMPMTEDYHKRIQAPSVAAADPGAAALKT